MSDEFDWLHIQYTRLPSIQLRVTRMWWEQNQDVYPHWEEIA